MNAVAYAHSRRIVHRDLKPSNVMIGPFEEVLVLDWGMAKILDDDGDEVGRGGPRDQLTDLTANTASRCLIGTPAYMAPEQFRGEPASFATDTFSLALILYELLALRSPWKARNIDELQEAMRKPPPPPTRVQPGRRIPHELAAVVLRALERDPAKRFPSLRSFSREVAHALEGRATWKLDPSNRRRDSWRLTGGRKKDEVGEVVLRSSGRRRRFRYFYTRRFTDSVRIEFEFSVRRGRQELSLWLNAEEPESGANRAGYCLEVLRTKRRMLSLRRSGRVVAGARTPPYEAYQWYRCSATRMDDRFSLSVDDEEIYVYHDPIPLSGGFIGLTGESDGLRLRNLRVYARGASARVSCLSIPDAFFNRRLYEEARAEYERIASSHPGRDEGRLAGFRAGLCHLEMARRERDAEVRSWLLQEAEGTFERYSAAGDSCLFFLGRAMVAGMHGDLRRKKEALTGALNAFPGDPHLPTVREWILGRLHSIRPDERRSLAELLPLAISHCTDDWGRRVVRDLVKRVRRQWEVPSFMSSRALFRENDPASRAEAMLFFGFWTANGEVIRETLKELLAARRLRPHHLPDAVFSLLELDLHEDARQLLLDAERALEAASRTNARIESAWKLCRAGVCAASGEANEAERLFSRCDPDPHDRPYNSARLWLARSFYHAAKPFKALKVLRSLSPQDGFAREHQAWIYLLLGDTTRADKQLKLFLERNDHRSGRNLSNFLHGTSRLMGGREDEAMTIFACLDFVSWPRTWTLGSHYAAGRLRDGSLRSYLQGSFPWERRNLRRQVELLARARGEPPESIPSILS